MEWLIPCNPAYYDVEGAFAKLKTLNWKQTSPKIEVGDIVFIYVSKPVAAVRYKCKVNKVNLPARVIDDAEFVLNSETYAEYPRHMELELIRTYTEELNSNVLANNGVKGRIQCPRRVKAKLLSFISNLEEMK